MDGKSRICHGQVKWFILAHPKHNLIMIVIYRVDMRGSGDSEGLLHDEYELQEQNDACEVIGMTWTMSMDN